MEVEHAEQPPARLCPSGPMPTAAYPRRADRLFFSALPRGYAVPSSNSQPPASNRLSSAPSCSTREDPSGSLAALRALVDPDRLSVVFQPIVDLASGKSFAHEALVRCNTDPPRSPPALFEQARRDGCVGRLGRMIREIAVPLSNGRPLFLNVHPDELSERWLVRPDDPVYAHDDEVFLEVTESVPLSHFELCLSVLRELRSRGGVHLVVDDLGAGFSNLKRIAAGASNAWWPRWSACAATSMRPWSPKASKRRPSSARCVIRARNWVRVTCLRARPTPYPR
jgi:hypothetical protein